MNANQLFNNIKKKKSFLCVGLDTDPEKIPHHLLEYEHPVFEFNKKIIDATVPYAIAYKPNLAFYESLAIEGWLSLQLTVHYIRTCYPDVFIIADAKRSDIGNTSKMYAKAFFQEINFDAITVAPYMGKDSVEPFLMFKDKWAILLALTSNEGAEDFQYIMEDASGLFLFENVLKISRDWGTADNMMYVVGATQADHFEAIRKIVPDHFLLVPGIGAQGGSLEEVAEFGLNHQCGLIVNSSRDIIYADQSEEFAKASEDKAKNIQMIMMNILKKKGLI